MVSARAFQWLSIGTILIVLLASGPFVPAVSLTQPSDTPTDFYGVFIGGGVSAERQLFVHVTALNASELSLTETDDGYEVTVPEAAVVVDPVGKQANLTYHLSIPALNHTSSVNQTVQSGDQQLVTFSARIESGDTALDAGTYDATVWVEVTHRGQTFTAREETVTLRVDDSA
ncbi:hypothetical protein [Haladaptatus sp. CMSO5]|uniref:hypothetical protein n=1 Tax=Haladaptatus sp. CMSO5 TaxID=3120514 RepID=UPI002FCE2AC4